VGRVVDAAGAFGNLPAGVADVVAQAIALRGTEPDRAEMLMWKAQAADPTSLEMYVGLAKFYLHAGRLKQSRIALDLGYGEASRQGRISGDWRDLTAEELRLAGDVGRKALLFMKGRAFIRLRQGHVEESWALLDRLAELDPDDGVGAETIRALARACGPEEGEQAERLGPEAGLRQAS